MLLYHDRGIRILGCDINLIMTQLSLTFGGKIEIGYKREELQGLQLKCFYHIIYLTWELIGTFIPLINIH